MTQVGSLRERKRQQTRIDLVRAAVRLFQQQGYEATTVDQIVELANYSKSTFFRYFGGKEDVVFLDMPDRVAQVGDTLAATDPGGDAWAAIREQSTSSLLEFLSHDSDVYAQCIPLWFSDPALWRRYVELMLQSEQAYASFLADAIGVPADDVGCAVLAAAVVGTARVAILRGSEGDIEEARRAFDDGFDAIEAGALAIVHPVVPRTPAAHGLGRSGSGRSGRRNR